MFSSTPLPTLPPGKDPVPIVQEAGWAVPIYAAHNIRTAKAARCKTAKAEFKQEVKVKVKDSIPGLDRPGGFQEDEAPRFQDNRHMKVVRLSALRTGRLYPPGNIPGTHFC